MKLLVLLLFPLTGSLLSLVCKQGGQHGGTPIAEGFPRQIIVIPNSSSSTLDAMVWDAGDRTEKVLPPPVRTTGSSANGTNEGPGEFYYLQIPHDAQNNIHRVRLRGASGADTTVEVRVLDPDAQWPPPRIEGIGIRNLSMNADGSANIDLAISAGNVDVDAGIRINSQAVRASFSSALTNPYFYDHKAGTFGYPVFHYGLLIAELQNQKLGEEIRIEIENSIDNLTSTQSFHLPDSPKDLDSDNDGLPDMWELEGYKGGGGKVDLRAMGCNPYIKDILVEADWIADATPDPAIWGYIEAVFANAPTLNPDGSQGIVIHIDRGQDKNGDGPFKEGGDVLPSHETMDFGAYSEPGYTDFFHYKSNFFKTPRRELFHYCVFGRTTPGGWSGHAEIGGNDFMVTFSHANSWSSVVAQVGTFIHELGHNLGLRHGGVDNGARDQDEMYKPNQLSSMNYRYQLVGFAPDCSLHTAGIQSYSQGMLARIDEIHVDENMGVCDRCPIDFNRDNVLSRRAAINVNFSKEDDWDAIDTLYDYNEWGSLRFNFRAVSSDWNGN